MTPLHLAAANGNEDVIFLLTSVYSKCVCSFTAIIFSNYL